MLNGVIFKKIISPFIIFILLNSLVKGQKSRCLYLLSESEIYNFYYLKSGQDENKYI